MTEIETGEKRGPPIPQFHSICRGRRLPPTQPFSVHFQMNGPAGVQHTKSSGLEAFVVDPTFVKVDRSDIPLIAKIQADREPVHRKGHKQALCGLTSTRVSNFLGFELIEGTPTRCFRRGPSRPPLLRLLPGGANQFPGGTFTRCGPAPFHGALRTSMGPRLEQRWDNRRHRRYSQ